MATGRISIAIGRPGRTVRLCRSWHSQPGASRSAPRDRVDHGEQHLGRQTDRHQIPELVNGRASPGRFGSSRDVRRQVVERGEGQHEQRDGDSQRRDRGQAQGATLCGGRNSGAPSSWTTDLLITCPRDREGWRSGGISSADDEGARRPSW
jgi:hypothetical protein